MSVCIICKKEAWGHPAIITGKHTDGTPLCDYNREIRILRDILRRVESEFMGTNLAGEVSKLLNAGRR